MSNNSMADQISSLVIEVVRQASPEMADLLKALTLSSDAEAWKEAGDKLLEVAIKTPAVVDAQFWYALACSCFERHVALSRR